MNNAVFGFICYMHYGYACCRIMKPVTIEPIASVHRSFASTLYRYNQANRKNEINRYDHTNRYSHTCFSHTSFQSQNLNVIIT